jgi:hypothetical protein
VKRHRSVRALLAVATLASLVLTPCVGRADPRSSKPPPASDDYGYIFEDDVMQAGVIGPSEPRIAIVIHGARTQLIRPRMAFVHELLKTVENL